MSIKKSEIRVVSLNATFAIEKKEIKILIRIHLRFNFVFMSK